MSERNQQTTRNNGGRTSSSNRNVSGTSQRNSSNTSRTASNGGRSTSTGTQRNSQNQANRSNSRSSRSGNNSNGGANGHQMELSEVKEQKKEFSRGKDIAIIFIGAFCILMYVSIFSNVLEWLENGLIFAFGWLRYVAPALIFALFAILFYREVTKTTIRRIIAVFLLFFAVSGLFSFLSKDVMNGGLLGRLNYWMFQGWLQVVGATVFNITLIIVSIALMVNFSLIILLIKKSKSGGEKTKAYIQKAEEERELRRLEKENQEIQNRRIRHTTLEEYREKNRALQDYEERERQRLYENEERFAPKKGICNTLITDNQSQTQNTETTFHFPVHNATEENASMFGKYQNSGETPADSSETILKVLPEDEPLDPVDIEEAAIPAINFSQNSKMFENLSHMDEEEQEGKTPIPPLDKYEKIVVTSQGKLPYLEADGVESHRVNSSKVADFSSEDDDNEDDSEVQVAKAPKKIILKEYKFPPLRLLNKAPQGNLSQDDVKRELSENAQKLVQALQTFGINVTVTEITCGPSVTRYQIQPEVGVKVSRITALSDDIKYYLAAKDIRIEAPIPGKSAIGIEVPNKTKIGVYIRDLIETDEFQNSKSKLSFVLGRDIEGHTIVSDIAKMPHVLIAGTTGSGKSVCLNTMIMSIIYHAKPTEVKMIMVDPKMVEMQIYNKLPHLLLPVITDPRRASAALNWACQEMDKRYGLFAKYQVRGIDGFNEFVEMETAGEEPDHLSPGYNPDLVKMPQIVIFVDEMSDMMMVARKEVEESIIRLAQKARAAGIHLVLATQSPRAEVLTGLIKANVPSRIALSVSSGLESRIIIDMNGAESLLGHGDMLYLPTGANKPSRIQGAFVSDKEIADVMAYLAGQTNVKGGGVSSEINLDAKSESSSASSGDDGESGSGWDDLFEQCGRFVIDNEKGTIGALQRKFSIGFNRAARIMDQLCEAGVVGEEEGTKPRRILMSTIQFDDFLKANKI